MKFRQIDSLSSISVSNPANHSKEMIQNIHPTMVKITLGVLIAPNGDGIAQLELTLSKAREFYGNFKHSSMNEKAKWMAINNVIEPTLLYPLLHCFFNAKEFHAIDSIMSQVKCMALGLNRRFLRAILHGPMSLGGIGVPFTRHKNSKECLNYFFTT